MSKTRETVALNLREPATTDYGLVRRVIFCLATVICLCVLWRNQRYELLTAVSSDRSNTESWCPIPDLVRTPDDGLEPGDHLLSQEQLLLQVHRLSEAVQISTESYDDNGSVEEDSRWRVFSKFHEVLEKLFPLL